MTPAAACRLLAGRHRPKALTLRDLLQRGKRQGVSGHQGYALCTCGLSQAAVPGLEGWGWMGRGE